MLKAANKKIIVKKEEVKDTKGMVAVPDSVKMEEPTKAKVINVGQDIETSLETGNMVYITKYSGHIIKVSEEEFTVISEDDLLAVEK